MLHKIILPFTHLVSRWLPSALLFSILLTFIVLFAAIVFEGHSLGIVVDFWGNGVWKLLPFSMQMVLILLLGSTLADAPSVQLGLRKSVQYIKSPIQGIVFVTVVSTFASWLNWGMGLILGALVAVEVAKKVKNSHFPLLIASAYSGFVVWHGGLSGSIPLKLASPSGFLSKLTQGEPIALTDTVFSPLNLLLCFIFLVSLPILNTLLLPKISQRVAYIADVRQCTTFERWGWKKYIPNLMLGFLFGMFVIRWFASGGSLSLNIVNMILFLFAILAHPSVDSFLKSVEKSVKSSSGIIVQFPLYAGIMGMMSSSGLTNSLSLFFISISSTNSFPLMTYFSAGIVNFFVPSGGGQWAVQGPIIIPAAKILGVPVAKASMALAWGDAWTNMLQPFWALPLLGISGLAIKDIMPYCLIVAVWVGTITSIVLLWF